MGSVPPKLNNDLHRLLRRETSLYQDLLGLLQREKEALLKQVISDFSETNRLKKDLVADLQGAEDERETLVSGLAERLGVPPKDVTLSRVSALLEERESADLLGCGTTLASILTHCQEISRENAVLLDHSFSLVESLIAEITDPAVGPSTYLPTGGAQAERAPGHLVERRA